MTDKSLLLNLKNLRCCKITYVIISIIVFSALDLFSFGKPSYGPPSYDNYYPVGGHYPNTYYNQRYPTGGWYPSSGSQYPYYPNRYPDNYYPNKLDPNYWLSKLPGFSTPTYPGGSNCIGSNCYPASGRYPVYPTRYPTGVYPTYPSYTTPGYPLSTPAYPGSTVGYPVTTDGYPSSTLYPHRGNGGYGGYFGNGGLNSYSGYDGYYRAGNYPGNIGYGYHNARALGIGASSFPSMDPTRLPAITTPTSVSRDA